MTDSPDADDDAQILPPDYSLWDKIGHADLDRILTPRVIEEAQRVIVNSSGKLFDEVAAEVKRLETAGHALVDIPGKRPKAVPEIVSAAFAIKTKAGLSGFDLIAVIAKSLQLFCERLDTKNLSARDADIVRWHIDSIRRLIAVRFEGTGGSLGEEILAEMEKIKRK